MNLVREGWRILKLALSREPRIGRMLPMSVGFSLTERCNSQCSMCDFWKRSSHEEISLKDIKPVLQSLRAAGVENINYSAKGEIFTSKHAKDILSYTTDLGFRQVLNTNALALANPSLADFVCYRVKPYLVSIGIDTTNAETYVRVRGVPGGLKKVLTGVRNLQDMGIKNITFGSVILDYNLADLVDLIRMGERMGISSVRFTAYQRYFQQDDEIWRKLGTPGVLEQIRSKMAELVGMRSRMVRNSSYYLLKVPDFYKADRFFPVPCKIGFSRMDIDERGFATLCPFMMQPIGNVFESDPIDLWFSVKAEEVRRKMVEGRCPTCWLSCYAEENIRFTLRHGLRANWEGLRRYARLQEGAG
jgi:Fe-coproporphyrin III synthase